MLFWNRKEVYIGNAAGFQRCRTLLTQHRIHYTYRLDNHNMRMPSIRVETVGRIGDKTESMYYVYVSKEDYENAYHILREGKF